MNITFFIGNGFDLNLGLNTSYQSFYRHYKTLNNQDLISKFLNERPQTWADLELEIGKSTTKIADESSIETFLQSKTIVETELAKYLEKEEKRLSFPNENDTASEFIAGIVKLSSEFSVANQESYRRLIGSSANPINYNFITFNYTYCLDRIVHLTVKADLNHKLFHNYRGTVITDVLKEPFHIHGTLDDSLIMGVNDSSQISNTLFQNEPLLTDYLIKSQTNELLSNNSIEMAKDIVNSSDVILLFGVSIGETDSFWWKYLFSWLVSDATRRLVIYRHDLRGRTPLASESLKRQKEIIDCFLTRAVGSGSFPSNVTSRISMIVNPRLFTFTSLSISK